MADESQPWTIGRLLNWTRQHLTDKGVDQPRLCSELLLAHALGCEKIQLYTRFEQVPSKAQMDVLRDLVRQAAQRVPVAYLIGRKEFFSLEFKVTPAVLVPRPETELLVQEVIDHCRVGDRQRWNILELGTGSGCIAVSLAKYLEKAWVVASDISPDSLAVAHENAVRHGVEDRVRLVQADGLSLGEKVVPDGGFDLLVSNPPYIADDEIDQLPPEVARYEPREALVAGPQGLAFYRTLAEDGPGVLWPGAAVFVEVGYGQHEQVAELFTAKGRFELVAVRRDLAGIQRAMHFLLVG